MGEISEIYELDRLSLFRGQMFHGPSHLGRPGEPLGEVPAIFADEPPEGCHVDHVVTPPAELVDRPLASDGEEPGLEASIGVQPIAGPPEFEEHHLEDVVGLARTDEPAEVTADLGPETAVALLERVFVPGHQARRYIGSLRGPHVPCSVPEPIWMSEIVDFRKFRSDRDSMQPIGIGARKKRWRAEIPPPRQREVSKCGNERRA